MDPNADPDPTNFIIDPQDVNEKLIFLNNFFCLFLFENTFTSFFKDKKSKRSHKAVGSRFFLLFLLGDRRIRSRIRIHTPDYWIRIRIQEAQKHTDPTDPDPDSDPDPQHWFWVYPERSHR
jgi:hypothetical protein